MNNRITLISLFAIIFFLVSCQKKTTSTFTFAFYNVENLFDTINNEGVDDESYLPESKVAWNTERYNRKLDNMSKVMNSLNKETPPAIFGICEVENLGVVEDLIKNPNLENANYSIIHKDSPDERGIDVALLYNPLVFTPIKNQFIEPDIWDISDTATTKVKTRDILYSKGVINNVDTLHVFVNHWVSRWGGQEETEPHRIKIAETIKNITDSILSNIPNANIIIAGDLNDNPTDRSLVFGLQAKETETTPSEKSLNNLSYKQFKNGSGSLYYKDWDMFDQIIVSSSLLTGDNGMTVDSPDQIVFKEDWMLYFPKKGPARPSRTASGSKYFGGFSDHLPVMVQITVNK
jgi:hypothetical protein